jgi:pimeloyl-ACP methyl ester carboxylesterase
LSFVRTTEHGLHVVRHGEPDGGPPVVVVHGGLDRASSFGRVARQLADVPVVMYDRRGYGRSIAAGAAPIDEHVEDLLRVIGGEPATVFGHSVGAVIAILASLRHPELVSALVAYEPPLPWLDWWPRRSGASPESDPGDEAERFMRQMVGDQIWERLPARTRAERRAEGPALCADLASLHGGVALFDPGAVRVPLLVAAGSETSWWHRRAAEELAAAVPGAELAVLAGADHGAHLGQPSAVAALVRRARDLG